MPKPKHDIKEFHWLALKEAVQKAFDKPIGEAKDIEKLHQLIAERTGELLSTSTLYRLFLSPTNRNIPYRSTLNILTDFCAFSDWDNFCKQNKPQTSFDNKKEVIPDAMGLQLLEICLQNHEFKSVIEYTKMLPEPWIVDYTTQVNVSEVFGMAIRHDLKARTILLEELARIPQGRHFFYETFIDLDNLNGYYGDSLDIYEKYLPWLNRRKALNDFLFIYCMRFWRAYLSGDIKLLKRIGYRLFDLQNEQEIHEGEDVHFYPVARWHAYHLIYWYYTDKLTEQKVVQTLEKVEGFINENNPHAVRVYLSKLFEALTVVGQTQHIPYLFDKYKNNVHSESVEAECTVEFYKLAKLAFAKHGSQGSTSKIELPKITLNLIRNKHTYLNYALQ